jgi:hypothetical protein
MNLVLRNQFTLSVDVIVRFEPMYIVFRGREGGTTDEGRAFFVPYDEIAYVRLERVVRLSELKAMYGETGWVDAEDRLSGGDEQQEAESPTQQSIDKKTPQGATNGQHQDPSAIAKQNLLERLRARRANLGGTTGRLNDRK